MMSHCSRGTRCCHFRPELRSYASESDTLKERRPSGRQGLSQKSDTSGAKAPRIPSTLRHG